jgi:hypothetical protein
VTPASGAKMKQSNDIISTARSAILDLDGIERKFLSDRKWCAVPIVGTLTDDSEYLPRIVRAVATPQSTFYGIDVELESSEPHDLGSTIKGLQEYLSRKPRLGDAMLDGDITFIALCPPREIWILAADPILLQKITGTDLPSAYQQFLDFAEDPRNCFYDDPGFRYYKAIYDYYYSTYRESLKNEGQNLSV